jgi:hypothetical protein
VSTWRCRACLSMNASRTRKCAACKKARPKRRRPAHLKALDLPYETYVELTGSELCGICVTADWLDKAAAYLRRAA